MSFIVAIDGPAGSGKGTITKLIADKLGLVNIDTGAMYRCVALKCIQNKIKNTDIESIECVLENISIELKKENGIQKVYLEGKDVSTEIRTPIVDANVAIYAALKCVREKMTPMQRKMGDSQDLIMEGRDIGITVFPDADVKIYLDASFEERAKRRYKQNKTKGIECTYEEVYNSIVERHKLETERELSPLMQAEDAIYLDSSNLSIEQVVEKIIDIIENVRSGGK